jgi:hypothetical protein
VLIKHVIRGCQITIMYLLPRHKPSIKSYIKKASNMTVNYDSHMFVLTQLECVDDLSDLFCYLHVPISL